jgi:hypothetical protein
LSSVMQNTLSLASKTSTRFANTTNLLIKINNNWQDQPIHQSVLPTVVFPVRHVSLVKSIELSHFLNLHHTMQVVSVAQLRQQTVFHQSCYCVQYENFSNLKSSNAF